MNYRHAYHAGNFADVLKHAVLAAMVSYLKRKDGGFRVIDTHAGPGSYDLGSVEAKKTGEWQGGIGRLLGASLTPATEEFLAPYLTVVKELNPDRELKRYPGSPQLVRRLMRKQDRLSAIELHAQDARHLRRLFEGDHQVRVTELDGWLALGGHLPPKEKRGLVLVDPPFEQGGEFDRLIDGLARASRRFAAGPYCLWYPLKADSGVARFHAELQTLGRPNTLVTEMWVRDPRTEKGLNGSGLVLVNPPYTLAGSLRAALPEITRLLAQDDKAGWRVETLVGEG
ncbi:23S rRNA (adenine(2030)-N(6))-methyltransferase RlmJ [Pseudohoeflea coraliihabitans]|uniref:Ribosomal RNA large subunit methyltransferase J n=1 Tax=Pseudohoeflea coraliihabitans TaxID=2860393 RepID=A0ABS6WRZ7_9HYPH|nr:23S rRNA (adenine(2030)-N(6))-methyltransferase RlmJ [Pseudohoeflea sp. DP4N28-3]MBW3098737.1 23S rRNA (adenine(2030)-N(6))-methyltransferase RlmJ [Pseudohoeflea sp. DP4N28-3]